MIIRIIPRGQDEAARLLDSRPVRSKITQAIRKTLTAGKREGRTLTTRRYTTDINRLGQIQSKARGLFGQIRISGSRNLIKRFKLDPATRPPHNPPGGLRVTIVRGQGGSLPHAFVNRAGIVFERTGKTRTPIRHLSTVSIVGAWSRVAAQVETVIDNHLRRNLQEVI